MTDYTDWKSVLDSKPITKLRTTDIIYTERPGTPNGDFAGQWGTLSQLQNTLIIASNGDDTNGNGSQLCPLATLAGANTIISANPSTKYNVIDYRKTASENFTIYPNANYYANGTIITCSGGGLGSGWSSASANVSVSGYIFDTTASVNFDFSSFSTSNVYNLAFNNCGSTTAGNGTFIFIGSVGNHQNRNVYINNFNGGNTTVFTSGLSFEFIDSINGIANAGFVNSLTATQVTAGSSNIQAINFRNTSIFGTLTLSQTSSVNHGTLTVAVTDNQSLANNPVIVSNGASTSSITLKMSAGCWNNTPAISGTNTAKVSLKQIEQGYGVFMDGDKTVYVGGSLGVDKPWAGNYGLPYATLSYALSQIDANVVSIDTSTPHNIKLINNINETGLTTSLLPNTVIDINGFVWTYNIVNKAASWNNTTYDDMACIIKNGALNPIGNGWNFDDTDQMGGLVGILRLQNIYLSDQISAQTATITFTHNDQQFEESFENCVLGNFNNGGGIKLHYPNQGLVSFDGGESPNQIQADGNGTSGGTSIYFDIKNMEIVSFGQFYFRNAQIYVNDVNLFWEGQNPIFNLYSSCQIYYDTTMLDSKYFSNGGTVTGITTTVAGTGYTHATATLTPSMTGGIQATAHATSFNGSGGITGWAIDNAGDGFLQNIAYNWVITGDGSNAAATSSSSASQISQGNNFQAEVTDLVLLPSYNPSNFTPTTDPITSQKLLYNYLQGIDNQFGALIPTLANGFISGLENVFSNTTTILVNPGYATISSNMVQNTTQTTVVISSSGAINKLDTGTVAVSSRYYIWFVANSANLSQNGFLFSLTSNSSPTFPAGYDIGRVIGGVITDGSANILKFFYTGIGNIRQYMWDVSTSALPLLVNGNNTTGQTGLSTLTGQLPSANGVLSTRILLYCAFTGSASWLIGTPDLLTLSIHGASTVNTGLTLTAQGIGLTNSGTLWVNTPDASPQIDWATINANCNVNISIKGFELQV